MTPSRKRVGKCKKRMKRGGRGEGEGRRGKKWGEMGGDKRERKGT